MTSEPVTPALLRGLAESRFSRRAILRGGVVGGGAIALSTLLAACGVAGTGGGGATIAAATDWTAWWAGKKKNGALNFANWADYIDVDDNGNHPSLDAFTKQSGIKVTYTEPIQDVPTWYAKENPIMAAGQDTGYDIMVITDSWDLTQMLNAGYFAQLDKSQIPNFTANAGPDVSNPSYDPGAAHCAVWQTGFTGLAYNTKKYPQGVKSYADLLDPALAGHIGIFADPDECGTMALLAIGADPDNSTQDDWQKAGQWLEQLKPSVAQWTDQGYTSAIESGDLWVCQAWSGDMFQSIVGGKPVKYVAPTEGQTIWHDNMVIPVTADNPVDALVFINAYYTPEMAGTIEDYVEYVCPVPSAKDYILNTIGDPDVANSPLVFPDDATLAAAKNYPTFKTQADFDTWSGLFNAITQS